MWTQAAQTPYYVGMIVTDEQIDVLRAGMNWLTQTIQPSGALEGWGWAAPGADGRRVRFLPVGYKERPVVIVDVAEPVYDADFEITNPLGGDVEASAWVTALHELGYRTAEIWNWKGNTGSISVDVLLHPSLLAAVQRYRRGCPEHPEKRVFCECGWLAAGMRQVVYPAVQS